jgi:DNA polymerase III subunit gamma/tau
MEAWPYRFPTLASCEDGATERPGPARSTCYTEDSGPNQSQPPTTDAISRISHGRSEIASVATMGRMPYVSLYRKYRPQTFSEILGQEHVSITLANAISEDRVAHAYLFTGPRGTGKTSTARILAKALNCEQGPTPNPCGKCASCIAIARGSSMDVFEMDAASHSGVDETREILSGVPLATAGGRKKIYVIDEVHMLTTQSFNALLKTLEEPPDHVVFVLATTEAHKVLPTIVSRTQRFDFRRMPVSTLVDLLSDVAKRESIDIEPDAVEVVARHAEGGARNALSALDQLRSVEDHITVDDAERLLGERGEDEFIQLFDALAAADIGSVFTTLDSMITQGADVRQLALGTLNHARSLMLLKTAPQAGELLDAHPEDRQRLADQAERFRIGGLVRLLELVGKAITEMRNAPNHRLFLEVALTRGASPETDASLEGVLGRIERLERRIGIEGAPKEPAATPQESALETTPKRPRVQEATAKPDQETPAAPASSSSEPEEEAPSVPVAQTSAGAVDHLGLGHIKDAWPSAMKEVAQRSKRVAALLKPSEPVTYDSDGLVVEVQSAFHASQMAKEANSLVLTEALFAALGLRPFLRFAERGAQPLDSETGSGAEGDASGPGGEATSSYSDAAEGVAVEHDPVELLKKGLDAEVVREVDEN